MARIGRFVAVLLLGLGLGLVGVVLAPPALACSCAGAETDAGYAARADAVFVGELVSRDVREPSLSGLDPAVLTFDVTAVYQGEVAQRQQVVTPVDGASCGLELSGSGPFLVFARAPADSFQHDPPVGDGQLLADLCGGSRPVSAGPPDPMLGAPTAAAPGSDLAHGTAVAGSGDAGVTSAVDGTIEVGHTSVPLGTFLAGSVAAVAAGALLRRWRRSRRAAHTP